MSDKEQSLLDIISKIICKAQGGDPVSSALPGDSFYAIEAGIYQGSLNSLQEDLQRGIPLERIVI